MTLGPPPASIGPDPPLARAATAAAAAASSLAALAVMGTGVGGVLVTAGFVAVALALLAVPARAADSTGRLRLVQFAASGVLLGVGLVRSEDGLTRWGFLIGLTLTLTTPAGASGLRAALGLGALLLAAAAATGLVQADWATVLWALSALVALALIVEADVAGTPRLSGGQAYRRRGRAVTSAVVSALLVLALAPALALLEPPPSFGAEGSPGGVPAPAGSSSPYVSRNEALDLADRPDWGDLHRLVLTVTAEEPAFWRGEVFDRWDGRRWTSSGSRSAVSLPGVAGLEGLPRELDPGGSDPAPEPAAPVERLVQRFEVETPYLDLLVAAPTATAVNVPVPNLVERVDGTIDVVGGLGQGASYTVSSDRVAATADLLRVADPRGVSLDRLEAYLELPDDVPATVRSLAATLDRDAATTFDLIQELHRWLGEQTEYTRDLPPLPAGADPVEQHLFVDRQGWCEQIATSSTVLLRLAGVPARLATGFVSGDRSLVGDQFKVRVGDAHAWVEVWFPGVGWQAFDPTASVPLAGDAGATVWQRLLDAIGRVWALLALVAGVALVVAVAFRLHRATTARRRRTWTGVLLDRLDRAGRRRGRPRRPPESVLAYAAALADGPLPDARLAEVGVGLTAALYGDAALDAEDRRQLTSLLAEIERANPPARWWRRGNPSGQESTPTQEA